jgi:pilus assembly protein Flp/PilA
MKKVMNFFKDEEGATMVEYGLMVALIAVVCITAVGVIGTNLDAMFDAVGGKISSTIP